MVFADPVPYINRNGLLLTSTCSCRGIIEDTTVSGSQNEEGLCTQQLQCQSEKMIKTSVRESCKANRKASVSDSYIESSDLLKDSDIKKTSKRTVLLKGRDIKRTVLLNGGYTRAIQLPLRQLKGVGKVLEGSYNYHYHPKVCYSMVHIFCIQKLLVAFFNAYA